MSQLDSRKLGTAVRAHFDPHTLAKGRVYQQQGRVQKCSVTLDESGDWLITADVRGSQRTPYDVEIDLFTSDDSIPVIQDYCSCPMEEAWKHVAAVLLHVLDKPEQWFNPSTALASDAAPSLFPTLPTGSRLDHPWDEWLRQLEQAAPASSKSDEGSESAEEIHYILR